MTLSRDTCAGLAAAMLDATDAFVAKRPDFPIKIGLYTFSSSVETLRPIRPYERSAIRDALATLPLPGGGTAIGDARRSMASTRAKSSPKRLAPGPAPS